MCIISIGRMRAECSSTSSTTIEFYDYRTNVELYPKWQAFLRERQPPTIIFWGQEDIFFTREGGESYLKDLPKAEMHRLNSGHFAVEDCLPTIVDKMKDFYRP